MDENRRRFIIEMTAIAGVAALDGFGLLRASSAFQTNLNIISTPSRDIKDYPHITDVISSKDVESHFPIIVGACSEPKMEYLSSIPFLIELEVCKTWSESRFQWDAVSNVGAAGLQQLMEVTAREYGLVVADSPEIQKLNQVISEYRSLSTDMGRKRQELHAIVESGNSELTEAEIARLNARRKELGDLYTKRTEAYQKLKATKAEYVDKVHSLTTEQLKEFDSRFVPELAIPAGVKHIVRDIMECKNVFGGPVEMNVWRGVAAYNSGLERVKQWEGLPYIQETVQFTRGVISNLTKALELKYAYSTKDEALIARTKMRMGIP